MHIIEVRDLTKAFGGVKALEEVKFRVRENSITSVIGPNGAGKTTLFNCLTGLAKPTKGAVFFRDKDISRAKPHEIVSMGIARTFQNIRLFKEMSVLENVMVSAHNKISSGMLSSIIRSRKFSGEERAVRQESLEHLEFVGLEDMAGETASILPYGSQKRLELARALASGPEVILLDEPAAGMNPQETSFMMGLINRLHGLGKTIVLIEHDMKMVMGISQYIIVLDHGVRIAEGAPDDIRKDHLVIEAYLGKEHNA